MTGKGTVWPPLPHMGRLVVLILILTLALAGCRPRQPPAADPTTGPAVADNGLDAFRQPSVLWRFAAGAPIDFAPVAGDTSLYVGDAAGTLHAVDLSDGSERWNVQFPDSLWSSSLHLAADTLYAGSKGGALSALDADSGKVLWRRNLAGEVKFRPAVKGDVVYVATTTVGTGMKYNPDARAWVYALRPKDGETIWQFQTDNFGLRYPITDGINVYVGGGYVDDNPPEEGGFTRIYALDSDSGVVRWTYESEDGFIKSMYVHDGILAFLAYEDYVYGLDAASGRLLWHFPTENWSPDFSAMGGEIYFSSANGFIHALNLSTGERLWKYRTEGTFNYAVGAPVIEDGVIYINTWNQEIHAVDATDGSRLWRGRMEINTRAPLIISQGGLVIADLDGTVHYFKY